MLHALIKFDIWLFYWINRNGQNALFDQVMPFISNERNFFIPIAIAWLCLMIWKNTKARVVALAIIALLACTDQLCTLVLKPAFSRLRPYDAISNVRLYEGPGMPWQITSLEKKRMDGNTKSMPSAHATNIFAAAVFLSYYFRRTWPLMFLIAAVVGYSRVYLGVHFPLDVVVGAITGGLLAWGMIGITNPILRKLAPAVDSKSTLKENQS